MHPEVYDKGRGLTWARVSGSSGVRFHIAVVVNGYLRALCGTRLYHGEQTNVPRVSDLPNARACPNCIATFEFEGDE